LSVQGLRRHETVKNWVYKPVHGGELIVFDTDLTPDERTAMQANIERQAAAGERLGDRATLADFQAACPQPTQEAFTVWYHAHDMSDRHAMALQAQAEAEGVLPQARAEIQATAPRPPMRQAMLLSDTALEHMRLPDWCTLDDLAARGIVGPFLDEFHFAARLKQVGQSQRARDIRAIEAHELGWFAQAGVVAATLPPAARRAAGDEPMAPYLDDAARHRATLEWLPRQIAAVKAILRVNRNGIQLSATSSILIPCGASFCMCFQEDL
jgi:hypothetical protein